MVLQKCPHCQSPVEAVQDATSELTCSVCGSAFRFEQERTRTIVNDCQQLARFELLEQLGAGAFGVVWKARDPELSRMVAVKIPHPGRVGTSKDTERFLREGRSCASLRHPGIVPVHEVGYHEGLPYLVADFIDGVTLADLLTARRLSCREAAELTAQVADALDYAHSLGVVHRDIKPSNIMLDRSQVQVPAEGPGPPGRPMLMDFGLALRDEVEATLTQEGQVLGTPAYMSPEQAAGRGHQVDRRSDVYSLGVVLYQLLTGELPFRGNARIILDQVLRAEAPSPARVNRKVPRDLATITLKCLAKEPQRRYSSAAELAADLRRWLAGEPVLARPVGTAGRLWRWSRRNPVEAGLFVALLGVFIAAFAAVTWKWRDAEQARAEADQARRKAEEQSEGLKAANSLFQSGQFHFDQGSWPSAHADFSRAVELRPDHALVWLARGQFYLRLGLWEKAATDFNKAFEVQETALPLLAHQQALLRAFVGDRPGYRKACSQLARDFDRTSDAASKLTLVRACVLAPDAGVDPAEVLGHAQRAVAAGPRVEWVTYVLGLAHYRAGHYQEAVRHLSWSARQTWSSRAISYPVLAVAHHRLGHAADARQALDRATTAIEKWTVTLSAGRVGNLPIPWVDWLECQLLYREAHLLLIGSPPREDSRLKAARDRALLALTEDAPSVWLERARTLASQGKEEEAGAAFCKVLAQTPTDYWHRSESSLLCAEIVQRPKAFAKAVALRPQDARLWIASGRAHARKRRWKEAAVAYARAMPALPPNDHVWCEYGAVLLLSGDADGYRRFCRRCIEQIERSGQMADPATVHKLARLCVLAPGGSDPAQLVRWADLAVTQGPRHPWYLHALAAAQYRAGQFEQAERRLQESLDGAWPGYRMSLIFLALAYHKLSLAGNPTYAKGTRELLRQTDKWLDDVSRVLEREGGSFPQAIYPADWLIVQVLRREAATLMGDKQKPPGN